MIVLILSIGGALVITGITIGVLAVVAFGVRREEKYSSLTMDSPSRLSSGARVANGVYAKAPSTIQRPVPPSADRLALAGHGNQF